MQTRKPLRAYQGSHKRRAKPSRAVARKGRTEEALRESENKFRDLAEKSIVGIYLIQDGKFKYVNPRFAEIFGYEVWEIMGRMAPWKKTSVKESQARPNPFITNLEESQETEKRSMWRSTVRRPRSSGDRPSSGACLTLQSENVPKN